MVRRQSCPIYFALGHFFYWQFIYNKHFIFKKYIANQSIDSAKSSIKIPIDKHVRLTSKSKTYKKRQWKYHILVVSCISNEKYNTNIMNMINIDIQHVMIHVINTSFSVLIDKEPFYFHQVCISSPHHVHFSS